MNQILEKSSSRGLRARNQDSGGLFNKMDPEGISDTQGRWIVDERAWLKEKKEKGNKKREGGGDACYPKGKRTRQRSHGFRPKLAGVIHPTTTVRGFWFREHCEKEEIVVSPLMLSAWPGVRPRGTLHGRRPWSSSELTARGLEGT